MGRSTWIVIGAAGVVLGCVLGCGKSNANNNNPNNNAPPPAETTASAPAPAKPDTAAESPSARATEHRKLRDAAGSPGGVVAKPETIPSGTALALNSNQKICTNSSHVGDTFTAAVGSPITTSAGGTLPSNSTVTLSVTAVKPSDNVTQHGQIGIAVDSLNVNGTSYPLDADIVSVKTTKVRSTSMGQEATKTGIGTAAGAILGAVIGHNAKTALIGAAAGTAAGAGTAYATTKYDFCIPQGGAIATKLTSDATLPVTS